jgi:EF hand domain-containing protein
VLALVSAGCSTGSTDSRLRLPQKIEMLATFISPEWGIREGRGWFRSGNSRYTWPWLSSLLDSNHDGRITRAEFERIGKPFLARLDRDHSGAITAEDLDWSENSEYLKRRRPARELSSRLDSNSNGRITEQEWAALYQGLAGDKGFMTSEDLADWLTPPSSTDAIPPSEMPTRWKLLKGVISGELGSLQEGPDLDSPAPDFTLDTYDHRQMVSLAQFKGKKPVALIFGSFT